MHHSVIRLYIKKAVKRVSNSFLKMASNDYHGGKANILYSIRDSERLDNLFILMIKYLKLTGQIPLDLSSYIPTFLSPIERWFSRLYGFLVLFSVLHVALFLAKNTFDILETGELEQITDSLVLTMIYFFASFSSAYWMFRQKRLMELFQQINQLHRHHSLAGVTFVSYRCSYNLAHKAVKYWNLWCIIGVVFWALAPLCLGSHTLPLPCWYPFDALVSEKKYRKIFLFKKNLFVYFPSYLLSMNWST